MPVKLFDSQLIIQGTDFNKTPVWASFAVRYSLKKPLGIRLCLSVGTLILSIIPITTSARASPKSVPEVIVNLLTYIKGLLQKIFYSLCLFLPFYYPATPFWHISVKRGQLNFWGNLECNTFRLWIVSNLPAVSRSLTLIWQYSLRFCFILSSCHHMLSCHLLSAC